MIEVPAALSPVDVPADPGALASGPFVVTVTTPEGYTFSDVGFNLVQLDENGVSWEGSSHDHLVHPAQTPAVDGSTVTFSQTEDGAQYTIRPLESGDGTLVGVPDDAFSPANSVEAQQSLAALADLVWSMYHDDPALPPSMGEDNLYMSRGSDGSPLALLKMSASHPVLIRQDNGWRPMSDTDDDLLGDSDVPVRAEAVAAWDTGDITALESLLMDDRFSPIDVTNLWLEVGDTEELKRLLAERSRDRVYERSQGRWVHADPNPDASTVDVTWSAIGAWDNGDLTQLAQVPPYDTDGEDAA